MSLNTELKNLTEMAIAGIGIEPTTEGLRPFPKGHVPWNKGRTKDTDPRIAQAAERRRETSKIGTIVDKKVTKLFNDQQALLDQHSRILDKIDRYVTNVQLQQRYEEQEQRQRPSRRRQTTEKTYERKVDKPRPINEEVLKEKYPEIYERAINKSYQVKDKTLREKYPEVYEKYKGGKPNSSSYRTSNGGGVFSGIVQGAVDIGMAGMGLAPLNQLFGISSKVTRGGQTVLTIFKDIRTKLIAIEKNTKGSTDKTQPKQNGTISPEMLKLLGGIGLVGATATGTFALVDTVLEKTGAKEKLEEWGASVYDFFHPLDLSKKHEGGGKGPTFITNDINKKGQRFKSYGEYQLSTEGGDKSTMAKFLKWSGYDKEFKETAIGSPEFDKKWQSLMADSERADKVREYISETHYKPLLSEAKKLKFNTDDKGIQSAIGSMGVQHGGAKKILLSAEKELIKKYGSIDSVPVDEQIKALYSARTNYVAQIPNMPKSIVEKRYPAELQDALKISKTSSTWQPSSIDNIATITKPKVEGGISAQPIPQGAAIQQSVPITPDMNRSGLIDDISLAIYKNLSGM